MPVIATFALSFTNWDSYNPPKWVGLDNFRRLLGNDDSKVALKNTLYYACGHVPLTLLASLGLALLLNRKMPGIAVLPRRRVLPVHHVDGRGRASSGTCCSTRSRGR